MDQETPVVDEKALEPPPAFAGHFDGLNGTVVHGWAVDESGQPCDVRLVVNGVELRARSDQPRADLAGQGLSQGQGGWSADVGQRLREGDNRIEAYFANGREIAGSPFRASIALAALNARPIEYRGAIDFGDSPMLIGWAVAQDGVGVPVTVEIEGQAPFQILTTFVRDDLVASGISNGSGAGWMIDVTDMLRAGTNIVRFRFPDGKELPGSPRRLEGPASAPAAAPPPAPAPEPQAAAPIETIPPMAPSDRPLSLTELDEVSLDDLIDAVAAGMIDVAPPPPPPEVEEERAPAVEKAAPARRAAKPGFFGRLFGRR